MDVGDWLRGLGLGRYETVFRDNEIDVEVLRELTESDLEKLGVPLGHRKRLLKAIADAGATAIAPPTVTARPDAQAAERRQLTVMFIDLVGSTALSAKLDPEDLRSIFGAYQRCCAELVQRNGGFVAKYMGDGVLAYFGYPQAHEDDAERAVEAGLALVEAVPKLNTVAGVPLSARVGIATGLVVVGDLIGTGAARERAVVGETPNLAARLQAIAEPNTVVIADGTRRLIGNLFELEDLGSKELRGIADPARSWRVLRTSAMESRFEALHAGGLTALVGREDESELLRRCWSRSESGEGQVVLLSGEPGIGKSRLTAALLERLADEPHTRLRYFCSAQYTNSALHPVIGQMERAAGFAHDDTPKAKLDKLDALLAQTSTSIADAALFADMLSLPDDGRYPALPVIPQQRREATLQALIRQIETLARSAPVLMIFEDVHWGDPTSLEVLGRAVSRVAAHRALLIVTFRPEFEPPWSGQPHVTAVALDRLTRAEIHAMVDHIAGGRPLPASIRQDIVERADGIPLFVEEMTKAVLEAGSESEARRTAASIPVPALAVPASLHASLMARLDRLGPAKEVARIGAVIGREFSHALIAAVAGQSENELASALERLVAAGLLFRQSAPPHASYLFKHALVQDAAYGTLLREPRRVLHARIAETLESRFPEIAERQPELLARHCAEAGQIEKAADLWAKAGQRSLARSALVEAAEQLGRALDLIATLPGTPALRRTQIKLQVALITPLLHVKGYNAPETKAAMERARLLMEQAAALGEPAEDPLLLFSVLYGFWAARTVAFNGEGIRALAAQFLALAQKQGTTVPLVIGHRLMGTSLMSTGDIAEGRAHCDRAVALYDPAAHRALAMGFGHDARVGILCYRPFALWMLGYPDAAHADADQALKDAREIGHAATLLIALYYAPATYLLCGDYQAATAVINELLALAEEKASVQWKSAGMFVRSWLVALTGTAADAVVAITAGVSAYRSTGATAWTPSYLSYLAEAHAQLGQFDDAWRCIGEATAMIESTGERWWEADIYRRAGDIALMAPGRDAAKAQACFERALAVARRQQAKSWELRAAISVARLRRDQGKRDEARDLLAPVYGWFTEGFDTFDLKQAKVLLDELAA
ncbi:MAG TPA: adenylate/guanylate cyclase domain-containing protein [Xanthobacteraceae bacterium]|nr:adenylate/guanylate cyclase domain-containing protein [Xanthobacteraceae bacterium]